MRVALTHPYSWTDVRRGAERVLRETARSLSERGHEVTVLTSGSTPGRAAFHGAEVRTFRRRFARARMHERWFGACVAGAVGRGSFDVVHSLMPLDAFAAHRVRRISGARCVYQDIAIPFAGNERNRDDLTYRERLARGGEVYGCMSQVALDRLHERTGRRGALIPGGVRLGDFTVTEGRAERPTVLFSGTLDVRFKRLPLLLRAMEAVLEAEPEARLHLSGPGDPEGLLSEAPQIVRDATVTLGLGRLDEQPGRYRRAWVTALPSVGESFGLVLLESLASGTPIVTSDEGAAPELVRDGAGVATTADDVDSLVAGLLRAIEMARDPATAGRCRAVAADYDWDTSIAPLLEALYES